jgi:hypothetical protein
MKIHTMTFEEYEVICSATSQAASELKQPQNTKQREHCKYCGCGYEDKTKGTCSHCGAPIR